MAGTNPYNAAPQVTVTAGTPPYGSAVGTAQTFVPEIWSDEVIAEYEKNLVLANLIKKMSMKGKKGDTIHIPSPVRGDASQKVAETSVSLIADVEGELVVTIDQHWEYSRMIEDITEAQALASLRRFYTSDAGYALARQTDTILFSNGAKLGDGDGSSFVHSNSIEPGAAPAGAIPWAGGVPANEFTDATMRDALQVLDDNDVPMSGRFFVIPPSLCNSIRGIERYNSTDFVNNKGTVNGKIGEIYGVDVYVSTNVPTPDGVTGARAALLAHKDVYVLAEQIGVRSQTQYKQEFLSTLYTADRLFGTQCYRPENGVNVVVAG